MAYHLAALPSELRKHKDVQLLPAKSAYYHEERLFSLGIVLVCLLTAVCGIVLRYRVLGSSYGLIELAFEGLFSDPRALLATAIFLVACGILFARRPNRRVNLSQGIVPLVPRRFCTYWILSFLAIFGGALPTVWFIFALWLTPWYRLPLWD